MLSFMSLPVMPSPITQQSEFVWTWNIFVTILVGMLVPIVSGMVVNSLKRHINRRNAEQDRKDDQIAELIAEKEAAKEIAISQWRQRFEGTLCAVKTTVDAIKTEMTHRVHTDDCKDKHTEMWEAVNDVRDKLYEAK
jgi:arginyl-tRNA synthetase